MIIAQALHKSKLNWKKTSFLLRHSITKKLLLVVFSIYFILTVAVTLIQMHFEYQFSEQQTITSMKNIQAMTQDSLAQAIWEFNTSQLDSILSGIYTNKSLVGVKLEIEQNSAIPELQNKEIGLINDDQANIYYIDQKTNQKTKIQNRLERLLPYSFKITHLTADNKPQIIGKIILYSSNKIVFDQVKQSYLILIINAIIKTLALWVCFLWAGYRYISRPLKQLTQAIKTLASGNWNTELNYESKKSEIKTEINTLFDSFDEMTHKLFTTQDKLERSRNRLNNIFDTMPSALIFIDNTLTIQGWNKYIAQDSQIEAENAIGKQLEQIYPAFSNHIYLVEAALEAHKEQQAKNAKIIVKKEDANRLFDIVVYPIISNQKLEAVIRIDDVTEKQKNDANLAQVEKLASVGALIAGIAHEINNPLGSIMQGTQNVIRRLDPELEANQKIATNLNIDLNAHFKYLQEREIINFLNSIHAAGDRASSIVKNMLKFTRHTTNEMVIYNLVDIIKDALQLSATDFILQQRTDFKQIKIIQKFYSQEVFIECHPMEIQQVILNLLKNAAQALEEKSDNKEISIILAATQNQNISLSINDNGPGIPEEIRDKIFQPFFTTKPIGQGTGLGLSVCRNIIVLRHHGTLDLKSAINIGTSFIITLPIAQPT